MLDDEAAIARAALDDARATGTLDAIADAIHRHLWPLYDRHITALQETVSGISGQSLARYPVLRMLHPMAPALAASSMPFDVDSLTEAPVFGETGRDASVTMQILAARMNGDLRTSAAYARELSTRVYEMDVPERAQRDSILWFLHYEIGSALLLVGDAVGAIRELSAARETGRYSGSPDAERVSLVRLALAQVLRGSVEDAAKSLKDGRALAALTGPYAPQGRATEAVAAALIALERAATPDAVDEATVTHLEATAFTWAFVLLARVRYLLLLGRPSEALETVRFSARMHKVQEGTLPADILTRIYIEVFLRLGYESEAEKVARSVKHPNPILMLQLTRLDLVRGDLDSAADRLRATDTTQAISPINETEVACLRTWEMAARGSLNVDIARRFATVARNPDCRRAVRMMPRWVVEAVRPHIPHDLIQGFEDATEGMVFAELGRSSMNLTASERRVLAALPDHERVADLASALSLSSNTVKTHLSSLYRKLGVSSRREAIEARRLVTREDPS